MPYSRMKDSVLLRYCFFPKPYRLNMVPKGWVGICFLVEIDRLILKFIWKYKVL